jgi:hypothetical protein
MNSSVTKSPEKQSTAADSCSETRETPRPFRPSAPHSSGDTSPACNPPSSVKMPGFSQETIAKASSSRKRTLAEISGGFRVEKPSSPKKRKLANGSLLADQSCRVERFAEAFARVTLDQPAVDQEWSAFADPGNALEEQSCSSPAVLDPAFADDVSVQPEIGWFPHSPCTELDLAFCVEDS